MTLTPEMVEIAPCPFDGNYLQLVVLERDDYCCVVCEKCDCEGPAAEGRTDAIKAWNRRTQSQRAVAIAELEELVARWSDTDEHFGDDHGKAMTECAGELRALIDRAGGGS